MNNGEAKKKFIKRIKGGMSSTEAYNLMEKESKKKSRK